MPTSYLPYQPEPQFLLPPSPQAWLPEAHLAYYISDTVDQLDLSAFHARYAKEGPRNQPFHPAMMVKVLLCGDAAGVFSSRKLGTITVDGTKLKANASRHKAMSDERRREEGEAAYRRRRAIAEAPDGWMKHVLGFKQFSVRGLDRVRGEWKLVRLALNLRRLCSLAAA